MPHALILGKSGSGKTTLAAMLCRGLTAAGKITIVCDPSDPHQTEKRWGCRYFTSSPDTLMQFLKTHQRAFFFLDEAGMLGKHQTEYEWLTTRTRHNGHYGIFICQSLQQLSTILRGQCEQTYLFRSSGDARAFVAKATDTPDLLRQPPLLVKPKHWGEFFHLSDFSELSKKRIDFRTSVVHSLPLTS